MQLLQVLRSSLSHTVGEGIKLLLLAKQALRCEAALRSLRLFQKTLFFVLASQEAHQRAPKALKRCAPFVSFKKLCFFKPSVLFFLKPTGAEGFEALRSLPSVG